MAMVMTFRPITADIARSKYCNHTVLADYSISLSYPVLRSRVNFVSDVLLVGVQI
jgi:hypothetical protein